MTSMLTGPAGVTYPSRRRTRSEVGKGVRVDESALGLSWFQLSQWLRATHCVCAARCLRRIFSLDFQPCLAIPLLAPHCVCAARRPRSVALDGIAALPVPGLQQPPGLHQISSRV